MLRQGEQPARTRGSRAFSSFVALSNDSSRSPLARLHAWVRGVCLVLWMMAILSTPYRPLILGLAILTTVMILVEQFRTREWSRDLLQAPDAQRRDLLEVLNRHRARAGLETVLSPSALIGLEQSAARWEHIDAMLATRAWLDQNNLRNQISNAADDCMMEIVSAYLIDGRGESISMGTAKMDALVEALENMDRATFIYPRQTELAPNVALPHTPELENLTALLNQA